MHETVRFHFLTPGFVIDNVFSIYGKTGGVTSLRTARLDGMGLSIKGVFAKIAAHSALAG